MTFPILSVHPDEHLSINVTALSLIYLLIFIYPHQKVSRPRSEVKQ